MARATRFRLAAALLVVCMAYVGAAYFAVPEFWTLWNRDRPAPTMLTTTTHRIPGDPINLGLVGARQELIQAFGAAGWQPAEPISFRTGVDIGLSVLLDWPDPGAPVSTLLFAGRPEDLAFEKRVGISADQRHHVRFWLADESGERLLWLGAASFDRGVGFSHETGQITHHIAPDLDAERDLIFAELEAAGWLSSTWEIEGIGATTEGRNGGGDPYFTDGRVIVGALRPSQ